MLAESLERIRREIAAAARRAGRDPEAVRLVAVTKTVGVERIREALALGLHDFGENRVQEALPKVQLFPRERWHFIGHLQTNKVKKVVGSFVLIHSLDRYSLAEALQQEGEKRGCLVPALVQVNVSGERSKHGLAPEELADFLAALRDFPRIKVEGLMTMAPYTEDPEETRPVFRRLKELQQEAEARGMALPHLSMGMSNDFTVAVEEGATIVRIGSSLFGGAP